MATYYWIPLSTGIFVAIAAGILDLVSMRIPNWLTYPAIIMGLLIALVPGYGMGIANSLLGLLVAFLPTLILFMMGSIGGGDVKLLAAMGAILGYPLIVDVMFYAVVVGAAIGMLMIVWTGRVIRTLKEFKGLIMMFIYPGLKAEVPAQDLRTPFGVAVALGTLWAIFIPSFRISSQLLGGGQ